MKKQYKAPVCITVNIDIQDIIASSPALSSSRYSDTPFYSDTSEEGLVKTHKSLWDDDWSE